MKPPASHVQTHMSLLRRRLRQLAFPRFGMAGMSRLRSGISMKTNVEHCNLHPYDIGAHLSQRDYTRSPSCY